MPDLELSQPMPSIEARSLTVVLNTVSLRGEKNQRLLDYHSQCTFYITSYNLCVAVQLTNEQLTLSFTISIHTSQ